MRASVYVLRMYDSSVLVFSRVCSGSTASPSRSGVMAQGWGRTLRGAGFGILALLRGLLGLKVLVAVQRAYRQGLDGRLAQNLERDLDSGLALGPHRTVEFGAAADRSVPDPDDDITRPQAGLG